MELKVRKIAIFCCVVTATLPMSQPRADGDKVVFPEKHADGVMYTSHDLAFGEGISRVLYHASRVRGRQKGITHFQAEQ